MTELDQLKDKMKDGGFFSLSKEEQARYKELKGDTPKEEPKKQAPKKEEKTDTITISKEELERLIDSRLKAEDKAAVPRQSEEGVWQPVTPGSLPSKTCTFRYYRNDSGDRQGIIIDAKHHKWDFDERSREYNLDVYLLTILYDDGTTQDVEMPLERLINYVDTETCEIVDEKRQTLKKITGKVVRPGKTKGGYVLSKGGGSLNMDSYKRNQTGEWTELSEVRDDYTFTVKRPNGQIFTTKKINL